MCVVYVMNPGAFISKRNGMVCIWQNHKLAKNIPMATLEGLVLMDKVQISSQLVAELLEKRFRRPGFRQEAVFMVIWNRMMQSMFFGSASKSWNKGRYLL